MNIEGIRKIYTTSNLYSQKNENTNNTSLPKESNNTYFKGYFDKYSDKNVILNSSVASSGIAKCLTNKKLAFNGRKKNLTKNTSLKDKRNNYISQERCNKYLEQYLGQYSLVDQEGNIIPRFDNNEKKQIADLIKTNPDKLQFINELLNELNIDINGNHIFRFKFYDIKILTDLLKDNPDNTQFINKLLLEKKVDYNGNTVARFSTYDIEKLINLSKDNPDNEEFIKELINEKTIDYKGNTVARFNAFAIYNIISFIKEKPNNDEFMKELINEKTIDNKGNTVARFNALEIYNIISFIKEKPNNDEFMKELINEKTIDNKGNPVARFSAYEIDTLVNLSKENPENIQFIKELVNDRQIDGNDNLDFRFSADEITNIMNFIKENPNNIQILKDLANLKYQENDYVLDGIKIIDVMNARNINPKAVDNLLTNPDYTDLLQLVNMYNVDVFSDTKILNKIYNKLNIDYSFFLINSLYTDNNFQLEFITDSEKQIFFVTKTDKGLEYNGSEIQKTRGDKTLVRREFNDGSYIVEEIKNINFENENIPISLKKTQFDHNDVQVRSEVLTPSKDKPGTYTINVYERGLNQSMKKKTIGTVELYGSKNQGMKYKRTVTSSDGTMTTHTIIQGPKGSGMKYEIKDKDGNILGTTERQYRKIDEDHYTSSFNWQKYDTQFVGDKVIASKVDRNGNKKETIELGSDILDPQLIDLFKQLPGDYFFKIKEMGLNKIYLNPNISNNCYYHSDTHLIDMSPELKNNPFIFAHELGHALDWHSKPEKICNNKDLINIYQKELVNYKETTSDAEGHSIDYFTTGELPLKETVAEFNALLSGLINQDFDAIYLRSVVLQQHFPRTCAKIMELMNK